MWPFCSATSCIVLLLLLRVSTGALAQGDAESVPTLKPLLDPSEGQTQGYGYDEGRHSNKNPVRWINKPGGGGHFPPGPPPPSGNCTGKITSIWCKENDQGQLEAIAYYNTVTGSQVLGCLPNTNWTNDFTSAIFLETGEIINLVQTCGDKKSLESITFYTNFGQNMTCGKQDSPHNLDDFLLTPRKEYPQYPYASASSLPAQSTTPARSLLAEAAEEGEWDDATTNDASSSKPGRRSRKWLPNGSSGAQRRRNNKSPRRGNRNAKMPAKQAPKAPAPVPVPAPRFTQPRDNDPPPEYFSPPPSYGPTPGDELPRDYTPAPRGDDFYPGQGDYPGGHSPPNEYPYYPGGHSPPNEYPYYPPNPPLPPGPGNCKLHYQTDNWFKGDYYPGSGGTYDNSNSADDATAAAEQQQAAAANDGSNVANTAGHGYYGLDPSMFNSTCALASFSVHCLNQLVTGTYDYCWNCNSTDVNPPIPPGQPADIVVILPDTFGPKCPTTPDEIAAFNNDLQIISDGVAVASGGLIAGIAFNQFTPAACKAGNGTLNSTVTISGTFVQGTNPSTGLPATDAEIKAWLLANAQSSTSPTGLDICAIIDPTTGENVCFPTNIYSIPFSFPPGARAHRLLLAAGVSFNTAGGSSSKRDEHPEDGHDQAVDDGGVVFLPSTA